MESDVRDRHGQPQQGMTLAKNPSKKVHNPFKDKSKPTFWCIKSLTNIFHLAIDEVPFKIV